MKKRILAVLMIFLMILGIAACGKEEKKDKIEVTIYLWDKSMTKEFTPWLEQQLPDISFTFIIGYNSMEFYTDLDERGALPDIITCRRFSLNDAAHLSDKLLDLSQTNVVGSFYDSYIDNNREPGGAVRWLPMCAEVDGYIANVSLFEEKGIPLPTNYAEFAEACRKFEELGLRCYVNDYREDYSCMEALQGCAIPELMTLDGTMWRRSYENEAVDGQVGLDNTVWPEVFRKFEQYMEDTGVKPEDIDMNFETMITQFRQGQTAIMRGTASDWAALKKDMNAVMLPYYGETAEDNWLLTYPTCQVAVNKAVEEDEQKLDAVGRVLDAMFSEEGHLCLAEKKAVLSYNKNLDVEISEVFSQVMDCINRNHLYIRLASTDMFDVSKDVVQNMIAGKYDATEAYKDFNTRLTAGKSQEAPEIITTQNTAYEYAFGKHGTPAGSAVLNTLRKQWGSDVAVGYSSVVASSVFEGEYSRQQLNRLLANRLALKSGELTGAELLRYMEWLVNTKEDGSNPIRHRNLIPVTSGMEYTLTDNGDGTYTLGEITINGVALDMDKVYAVMTIGDDDYIESSAYCNCPMPTELKEKLQAREENLYTLFVSALEGGKQLEPSVDYVTVLK